MISNRVSIYGIGALGTSLAKALFDNQCKVVSLFNRTLETAEKLSRELNGTVCETEITANSRLGDLIFLTVSDDVIGSLAHQMAGLPVSWSDKIVVHCSGVLTSSALAPLKKQGASVAAFHPLQTFSAKKSDAFKNIYFTVEGDDDAVSMLHSVAKLLSSKAVTIQPEDKALLHTAAVMASNYLAALMYESTEIASVGSIKPEIALNMLKPLITETVSNIFEKGPAEALSGPIARGDYETIKQHLELLTNKNQSEQPYKIMGLSTCDLAAKKGSVNHNQLKKLRELLS